MDRQCTRESRKFASEYLCLVGELSKICVNNKRRGHGGKGKVGQDKQNKGPDEKVIISSHLKEICGSALPLNRQCTASLILLSKVSKGFLSKKTMGSSTS